MGRGDDPVLHGNRMVDPAVIAVIVLCAAAPLLLLAALLGLGVRDCRKAKRRLPTPKPIQWDNVEPVKWSDDPKIGVQNWKYN